MAVVCQINHNSYRIYHGRNMPPFYSYEKTYENFVRNYLSKTGPRSLHFTFGDRGGIMTTA